MLHNRIAEFEGANELAQAGKTLLNDPSLDLAIVHDIPFPYTSLFTVPKSELLGIINTPNDIIPEFNELDDVVHEWWKSTGIVNPGLNLREHSRGNTVSMGSPLHIDQYNDGPLSLSLRVDNSGYPRTFYARRSTKSVFSPNGEISYPNWSSQDIEAGSIKRRIFKLGVSAVKQWRGDAVLFANNPYPSAHGVNVKRFKTEALVFHYLFDIKTKLII